MHIYTQSLIIVICSFREFMLKCKITKAKKSLPQQGKRQLCFDFVKYISPVFTRAETEQLCGETEWLCLYQKCKSVSAISAKQLISTVLVFVNSRTKMITACTCILQHNFIFYYSRNDINSLMQAPVVKSVKI